MIRKSVLSKWREPILFLSCLTFTTAYSASTTKTNDAVISFVSPTITWDSPTRSEVLVDRFLQETVDSDSIVFDRVTGPSARLSWARKRDVRGYGSIEQFNSQGRDMFASIAVDSLRTAAIAALPLDLWEERWEGWLGRMLHGTIGNPEEEHVQMTSISYSAVRSSWERGNDGGGIQWGFRPWRTNPYVYFLAHAGRYAGMPLFTFEGRGGYTMFGSPKLEARVTLQLPAAFRLAGGASVDPSKLASNEEGANRFSVTLERVLRARDSVPESIFFIGFRSGLNGALSNPRVDNQVLAGIAKHW
jgi:hypothetical protein